MSRFLLCLYTLFVCLSVQISAGPHRGAPSKAATFEPDDAVGKGLWELVTADEDLGKSTTENSEDPDDAADGPVHVELDAAGNVIVKDASEFSEVVRSETELVEDDAGESPDNIVLSETDSDDQVQKEDTGISSTTIAILAVVTALTVVLLATGMYFKRAAEALKAKSLAASDSEDEGMTEEDSVSYDDNNPRVTVNRQLLDRMTSISNKLKASVAQARSETSSSYSEGSGERSGSARAPLL